MINLIFIACIGCFEAQKITNLNSIPNKEEEWTCELYPDGREKSMVKIRNYDPNITKGVIDVGLKNGDNLHYHMEKLKLKTDISLLIFPPVFCKDIKSIHLTPENLEEK